MLFSESITVEFEHSNPSLASLLPHHRIDEKYESETFIFLCHKSEGQSLGMHTHLNVEYSTAVWLSSPLLFLLRRVMMFIKHSNR
jgi:hypothetical protein